MDPTRQGYVALRSSKHLQRFYFKLASTGMRPSFKREVIFIVNRLAPRNFFVFLSRSADRGNILER